MNDRSPNWNKWLHIPEVMLWQAAALSLNIDPDKANYSYSWPEVRVIGESQEFKDRLEILQANLAHNLKATAEDYYDSAASKIKLREFALWAAQSISWEIPKQLSALADELKDSNENRSSGLTSWKTRQLWTLAEASYLIAGEVPPAPPIAVVKLIEPPAADDLLGLPAIIYRDLKDAIDLQRIKCFETRTGELANRRVIPADVVTWAKERRYSVPEELADLVTPATESSGADQLDGKERITAYKLILGMAIAGFRFDPAAARSDASGRIAAALETIGIRVTDDTIRTWLQNAKERVEFESKTPPKKRG